jgi:serine/threonine protein kinase
VRGKIQRRSVTGDSAPFDNPPPKFGRYRVQHQIGVGATGPVFRSEDPETHAPLAIKALRTYLPPDVNQQVVDDLQSVIDRLPSHPSIVPLRAVGAEDQEPFLVSDLVPGEALDVALKRYGPGAILDLLPRVRSLAEALDLAADHNLCHGAIHPRDVIVSDGTYITGIGVAAILGKRGAGVPIRRPYTAPEIGKGEAPTPASDQFALAALTFEWLFGDGISGPAYTPMEVPALPSVRHEQLSDAFTTALSPEPSARFANCRAFVDGLIAAVPALASGPPKDRFIDVPLRTTAEPVSPWDDNDPLDTPVVGGDRDQKLAPGFSSFASNSMFASEQKARRGFGLGALAATLLLGLLVGLAGGYVASKRLWPAAANSPSRPAARPEPDQTAAKRPEPITPPAEAKSGTEVPVAPPIAPSPEKSKPDTSGRLTIRSTPTSATVWLDGVMKGVTPLTLSGVELGSRTVTLSRIGYAAEERHVTLSKAQPSLSLDVRMSAASAAAPRPAPSAAPPSRAAAAEMGSLTIDSRPPGAAVTVNGVPRGATPLLLDRLPPGDYTVTMRLANFRPVSMVVRVVAGERARAAASLTRVNGQE